MYFGSSLCMTCLVCMVHGDTLLFTHAQWLFHTIHVDTFTTFHVTEAFATMWTLSMYVSSVVSLPFGLYLVWSFVRPSCFHTEAFWGVWLSMAWVLTMWGATWLAIHVLSPLVWAVFLQPSSFQASWQYAPRLAPYVQLMWQLCVSMQVLCHVPWIAGMLHVWHMSPLHGLVKHRKRMHVGLLLCSALVCPPDVMSQLLCWCVSVGMAEAGVCMLCVCEQYTQRVHAQHT